MDYFLQVIFIYTHDKKYTPSRFIYELSSKYVGVGVNFAILKEN